MSESFLKAYRSLNQNQKTAVDTLDGPVMVMAGPGTGKTQVLTTRIANILHKTDTPPESILALTFTDAATNEMRHRLINMIGQPGYFVRIFTFHGFCHDVISANPDKFIVSDESETLTDLERIEIYEQLISQTDLNILRPLNDPTFYLRSISDSISKLKQEGVTPEKFKQILDENAAVLKAERDNLSKTALNESEKNLNKNQELLLLYKAYQQELKTRKRYDYSDMINWVVEAFESDSNFLLSYQEKLQYILVDEYQDTNSAQNRLLFSLSSFWGENANVFAVGDPNQSIFRFQGASQENLKEYINNFPRSLVINLTNNYRSTQSLLDSAATLIGSPTPLIGNKEIKSSTIATAEFSHSIFEDYYLCSTIKEKLDSGIPASDIAVIARKNQDLSDLSFAFHQFGIPFTITGEKNILTDPIVKQFIHLLSAISKLSHDDQDVDLFTLLNYDFIGLQPLPILQTIRAASVKHQTLVDYLTNNPKDIDKTIMSYFEKLNHWAKQSANLSLTEFFQTILYQSNLLSYILNSENSAEGLSKLQSLFTYLKKEIARNHHLSLSQFLEQLDRFQSQNLTLAEQELSQNTDKVTLTTIHKSKGREWHTVFLYRCIDGQWGNVRSYDLIKLPSNVLQFSTSDKEDKNAEERRLFYVALTRTKVDLYISSTSADGKLPSLFISDLPKDLVKKIDTQTIEDQKEEILELFSTLPAPTSVDNHEAEFLKTIIADIKLSVTALNTYLDCPYKFKLNNLYRIPRAKTPSLSFGTAVHSALEHFHRQLISDQTRPSKSMLLDQFEAALSKEILTKDEYSKRLKHGQEVISAYYDFYENELWPSLATESYFSGILDDITLVGKVDRIDLVDESDRSVRVVDYKTGKGRTRNEIEGKTKNSNGGYKRQLVFYRLLAELDKRFRYTVTQAEIDFVEPDKQSGKFRKEKFIISDEEVRQLKELIKKTMSDIRALKFDRTTDTTLCSTCEFRSHCYPLGLPQ